ncbi:MAG TPA: hypothetical protein VHO90_01975 [Bacteroidales bacterium]|nr:hypothetical protein [Bacteroidales bacterium]
MQSLFPEGFIFIHSLYGLTWCELECAEKDVKVVHEKAVAEALFAYNQIDSEIGRFVFDEDIVPKYGVFYNGWRNYLLAKILLIDSSFINYSRYVNQFESQCESIAQALKESKGFYLESYYAQAWPADMFVAMASLALHDRIFAPRYQALISQWLQNVKANLDSRTGLIPHAVNPVSNRPLEGPRGSSSGLIIKMLLEIDPAFAKQQFQQFRKYFVSTALGLPSVREYPEGSTGSGDIDSGPVFLGVGFAATIDALGLFSRFGFHKVDEEYYKTISAFGFVVKSKKQKKYLFGKMAMADAFIAWGRSFGLTSKDAVKTSLTSKGSLKFHIFSVLLIMGLWLVFLRKHLFGHKASGQES